MIDLNFKCVQCNMAVDEIPNIAQSCENYIHCTFDFCPDWASMETIVANFKCGVHGNVVSVPVENEECIVPASVIKWPDFRMSLFGTNGDTHISTVIVEVPVLLNNLENGEPEPDNPDIFDAILNSCTLTQDEMDQFRADAAAGMFNGEPFAIYKIYESIANMNADAANVPDKSFVLISSGIEDPDNAKLFVKNGDVFEYLTDMSGATGIQGAKGDKGDKGDQGIQGIQGVPGADGADGEGVPTGGTVGQALVKKSATNYDTEWKDVSAGGIEHVTTTGTGAAYKATSTTVSATPQNGDRLLVIPHCVSTVLSPTLSVNNGTAYPIVRRLSTDSGEFENLNSLYVFNIGDAVELMFDSSGAWVLVNNPKVNANDLKGAVPISSGGTGATTADDARAALDAQQKYGTLTVHQPYKGIGIGDCWIFEHDGHNFIIDFGGGQELSITNIKNYLVEHDLLSFDAALLTHYHGDHIGGLESIITDSRFDFSDCTFYVPPTSDYSQWVGDDTAAYQAQETTTKGILTAAGHAFTVAPNNTELDIAGLKVRFLNADPANYSYYYNETVNGNEVDSGCTQQNNFAVATEITHGMNKLLIISDCQGAAQARITPLLNNVDFASCPHHGINYNDDENYLNTIVPTFAFQTGSTDNKGNTVERYLTGPTKLYRESIGDFVMESNGYNLFPKTKGVRNWDESMMRGIPFSPGDDLNDFVTPGVWVSYDTAASSTITNAPCTTGFRLKVERDATKSGVRQTAHVNETALTYIRHINPNNGTVGEWMVSDPPRKIGKVLFSGTLAIGSSVNIPEMNDYVLFAAQPTGSANTIVIFKNGTYLRAISGYSSSGTAQRFFDFSATLTSAGTLKLLQMGYIDHNPSGSHGARSNLTLEKIYGIV